MNRRISSVLAWLDSICMAAERIKSAETAVSARLLERTNDDVRCLDPSGLRKHEEDSYIISDQDPFFLRDRRDVNALVRNE
jgi:hypothetical protein